MDSSDISAIKEAEVKLINKEVVSDNEGSLESSGNEELIADPVEDNAQEETIEKAQNDQHQEELQDDENKETDLIESEAPSKKQKIEGSEENAGLSQEIVG